jgi:hypothetical protein
MTLHPVDSARFFIFIRVFETFLSTGGVTFSLASFGVDLALQAGLERCASEQGRRQWSSDRSMDR